MIEPFERDAERYDQWFESLFYRDARFYSADEVAALLTAAGLGDLVCVPTLFEDQRPLPTADAVRPGHGQGGFVVMRATKL